MVPLTCGKLQPLRGLGVALLACVVCIGAAAQGSAGGGRDFIVSSTLERIATSPPSVAAEASVQIAADAVTSSSEPLIVSIRFTNASEHVVDSIRITSAMPADVQYVPNSASAPGSDALFSVDDGRSFGRPEELTLAAADGAVRPADAAEYTHVRWILRAPLDAGATGIARFRVVAR
jgi:hypothetical protein